MSYMLRHKRLWKRILAMALVLFPGALLFPRTHSAQDTQEATPNPKDKAEWVNAGFKFGWMGLKDGGTTAFEEKKTAGSLPSFRSSAYFKGENLTNLPAMSVPFGLLLDHPLIRDRFLHGLASFQQVRFLCLRFAGVTDAGMKEIAKLKDLKYLEISQSPNTELGERADAVTFNQGLKHFAALAKLEVLNLSNTKCGDDGIENLGEMKPLQVLM